MPRRAVGLTAAKVLSAKPGRYGDGDGLYLMVRDNGTRFWVFRYTPKGGKLREMGLGRAPVGKETNPDGTPREKGPIDRNAVSLSEARDRASALYRMVRDGMDPLAQRDAEEAAKKAAAQVAAIKAITFRTAALDYIGLHQATWGNPKHRQQWLNTLETYAFPHFGDVPVSAVETPHVLAALQPIWTAKPETASRLRGRIEVILDAAKTRGLRTGDNPAAWKGHLALTLPARAKVAKVEHHAALPWQEVNAFMATLATQPGIAALALRFAILTAARTGEVLGATWREIDLDAATWTIPPLRMKAGREHRVPLSDPALGVLTAVAKLRTTNEPDAPLFPGAVANKGLSNMAMLTLLRRMKRDDLTTHGFRSTFRDWAAETTAYPGEVVEMALAHVIGDKTEAAYRRGDLFEKRRRLMQEWGAACLRPVRSDRAGSVVVLRQPAIG
jgi:integrase